jgi:hypothetical protein
MSIYHYGVTLEAARAGLKRCPTFRASVDIDQIRKSARMFERHFPFARGVRHAIAHTADFQKTAEQAARNTMTEPFIIAPNLQMPGGIQIWNGLINRDYVNTIDGRVVKYEVSGATVLLIKEITMLFYTGLPSAK